MRRPLWSGDAGIDISEHDNKEIKEISLYQANYLGNIHAQSNESFPSLNPDNFNKMAQLIEQTWREEMKE